MDIPFGIVCVYTQLIISLISNPPILPDVAVIFPDIVTLPAASRAKFEEHSQNLAFAKSEKEKISELEYKLVIKNIFFYTDKQCII